MHATDTTRRAFTQIRFIKTARTELTVKRKEYGSQENRWADLGKRRQKTEKNSKRKNSSDGKTR